MYHPSLIQRRLQQQIDVVRLTTPTFEPMPLDIGRARQWAEHLGDAPRILHPEEIEHVTSELLLCKSDFRYWAERYGFIKGKQGERELFTFMESQEIILRKVAELEGQAYRKERTDGILIQILKARQLGASTFAELIIGHRGFFYGNLFALVAGDVPEQSAYLFDMLERIYANLPWWMQPTKTNHVKDYEMNFGSVDTLVRMGSGKSTRGGFSADQGRGEIGRGKTINLFHGSELSTWEEPTQIDRAVEPAIPISPRSFGFLESTARGQDNWWHDTWRASVKGFGRWSPVFIPWYAETKTYSSRPPEGWEPLEVTKNHAARVYEQSPRWCGSHVTLTPAQMCWWQRSYLAAKEKRLLHVFLSEYCADPEESFTSVTTSAFSGEMLYDLSQAVRPLAAVVDVRMQQ